MAILESKDKIELTAREVAVTVARAVIKAGLPIPSSRYRNDLGHVQIDPIVIEHRVTDRRPGVQVSFEIEKNMGVQLNVELQEFEADPAGYMRNLMSHLGPMVRNVERMRKRKQAMNEALYQVLTEGAQNG